MLTRSQRTSLALAAAIALPSGVPALENGLLVGGVLPEYREMALSPGGGYLAALYSTREGTAINVLDLRSKVSQRIALPAKDGEITGMIWKGDDRVLFVVERVADEPLLLASDRSGNEMRILARGLSNLHDAVLSWMSGDPATLLLSGVTYETHSRAPLIDQFDSARMRPDPESEIQQTVLGSPTLRVWRLNAFTGETLPAPPGANLESAVAMLADTAGQFRFAVQKAKDSAPTLLTWHAEPASWFPLTRLGDDPALRFVALDEESEPLVLSAEGREFIGVHRFDPQAGLVRERLLEAAGADVIGPWRNPADGDVIGYRYLTDRLLVVPATDPVRRLAAQLAQRHPHDDVAIVSLDAAKRLAVGKVSHAWGSADFELMATSTGLSSALTAASRDAAPERMLRARVASKGGIEIPVTLLLPEAVGNALPALVVRPLGPMTAARLQGQDNGIGWLRGHGYAVLNVITRGARGLGTRLRDAGKESFGREALDDVTAAVEWARASGRIDARRIAVQGELFDADLALLAASRAGQPFRCVIAVRPLADLEKYAEGMARRMPRNTRANWEFLFGDVGGKLTREQSPHARAAGLTAPAFVAHWEQSRAEKYVVALRRLGKPVTAFKLRVPKAGEPARAPVTEALAGAESFLAGCFGSEGA